MAIISLGVQNHNSVIDNVYRESAGWTPSGDVHEVRIEARPRRNRYPGKWRRVHLRGARDDLDMI